ncbi:GTPase [Streptosporangium sp. NPDC000239]|uniref:GTPase n=1 Tax=Streptosporangium sp. NPDC000239 TaxID=3154248 RepID=UPI00332D97B4
MKSAANRPTPQGERDRRGAEAPQGSSDDVAGDEESPGERTMTFPAIRPDEPPQAPGDAFEDFRRTAQAAISSVNKVVEAVQAKGDAPAAKAPKGAQGSGATGTPAPKNPAPPKSPAPRSQPSPGQPSSGRAAPLRRPAPPVPPAPEAPATPAAPGGDGGAGSIFRSGSGRGRGNFQARRGTTSPARDGLAAPQTGAPGPGTARPAGEASQSPAARSGAPQSDTAQGGASQNRASQGGTFQDGASRSGAFQEGVSQSGATMPVDDAFEAFRRAAEAAISSVNEVVAKATAATADSSAPVGADSRSASEPPATEVPVAEPATEVPVAEPATEVPVAEPATETSTIEPPVVETSEETSGDPAEDSPEEGAEATSGETAENTPEEAPENTPEGHDRDEETPTAEDLPEEAADGESRTGEENDPEDDEAAALIAAERAKLLVIEEEVGEEAGEETEAPGDEPEESDELPESEHEDGDDRVRELPLPEAVSEALTNALAALRNTVTDLHFGLELPGAEEARRAQSEILAQLDDYVIPRVHMSTAPALVVIAGSTGAGKSTLLNTLANAKVSATGVRRPTTGTPVLACHPDDREWFAGSDLLGSLRRLDAPEATAEPGGLVLVSTERLPTGVALLDTPDIDSVVEEHHEIAHRMLDAADLWIFVTTAARYADAPAWRLLRLAKERGARLAIVLSRVPVKSREVVTKHFVRMLTEYGLGEVERFVVDESRVTDGMLPDHEVTDLRLWLTELSVDDQRRAQAIRTTLSGALDSFRIRIPALARQLEAQVAFRNELRGDVEAAYSGALAEIEETTGNGTLLRGEVLARWQDFAGSGDLMRTLHLRRPGRFAGKASQQAPERLSALKSALRAGLESVVVSAAQRAAEEAVTRWLSRSGAGESLAATAGLGDVSDDFSRRAGKAVSGWQDHIIELIRTEGVTKRAVAKLVSFDVESLAVIFVIGLLGYGSAEAEGAGTGGLPQRLVHALLGAESLRTIGAKARSDLRARIATLFDDETSRYFQVLDGAGVPDESIATRLYQATYNLEVAR